MIGMKRIPFNSQYKLHTRVPLTIHNNKKLNHENIIYEGSKGVRYSNLAWEYFKYKYYWKTLIGYSLIGQQFSNFHLVDRS